jgi:hypothetical protein
LLVERRLASDEPVDAAWELGGNRHLDMGLRLAVGRAVIHAHGGSVEASRGSLGQARLAFCLPLVDA